MSTPPSKLQVTLSASSAPQTVPAPVYTIRCTICGCEGLPPRCYHGPGQSLAQLRLIGYRRIS